MSRNTFIIAEIGSNHGGSLDEALRYVEACARAGADAVKFQSLTRDSLIARVLPDPDTDGVIANPKYAAFANQPLPQDWLDPLSEACERHGVEFMSTPFSLAAVDELEAVGVRRYKIASGDLTFTPLLERVARTGKPVLLSTGASYLDEVADAVQVLSQAGCPDITVLHCTATYPPSWDDLNLRAIPNMANALGLPVGLSDHSPGATAALAAIALGAVALEKHVTFDRELDGPDHPFAMQVEEFATMSRDIRDLERALGDGQKKPAASEIHRRRNLRRGRYDAITGHPAADGDAWLRPQTGPDKRAERY
ncbi:N-acetylneuraminate synthase family protein [Maricaulis sp. CAU 1757]